MAIPLPYRPGPLVPLMAHLPPGSNPWPGTSRPCARFEAMAPVRSDNAYLTEDRRIPPTLLASPRFAGAIRTDARGNVVFPHHDERGLCGFEIKNRGFTGFAQGGTKALWMSALEDGDNRLVIAETAIDALSYAAIRGFEDSRFASIAGQMNPAQPGLLIAAMRALPPTARVVLAFDNDDGGDALGPHATAGVLRARARARP